MGLLDKIGGLFTSGLDSLGTGLTAGITSVPNALLNQALGERATEHAQNISMDAWHEQQSTKYQHMVKDLRRAGLNPILAITGGVHGGGGGPSASPVYPGTGFSSASDVMRAGAEKERVKSEIDLRESQIDLNKKTGLKLDQEKALLFVQKQHEWLKRELTKLNASLMRRKIEIEDLAMFRRRIQARFFKESKMVYDDIAENMQYDHAGLVKWLNNFFNDNWRMFLPTGGLL